MAEKESASQMKNVHPMLLVSWVAWSDGSTVAMFALTRQAPVLSSCVWERESESVLPTTGKVFSRPAMDETPVQLWNHCYDTSASAFRVCAAKAKLH